MRNDILSVKELLKHIKNTPKEELEREFEEIKEWSNSWNLVNFNINNLII